MRRDVIATGQGRAGRGGWHRRGGSVAPFAGLASLASLALPALLASLAPPAMTAGRAADAGRPEHLASSSIPPRQVPLGYRFAGELTCVIGGGITPGLGADRDLGCTFARRAGVAERYDGITGIVTGRTQGPQSVVFAVWMANPGTLAALAGSFNGATISPAGDGALTGGLDDGVVLTPLAGRAATDLEALNTLLRLDQLHLNYGGRLPAGAGGERAPSRRRG